MSTESKNVVVGPGKAWTTQLGAAAVSVTATAAGTTTTFTVSAADAAKLRVGDMLTKSAAPAYTADEASTSPIITDISAANVVTVLPAFVAAIALNDLVYRLYRDLGATDGGIEVNSQITLEDQEVDQEVDPIDTVVTKRETTVMLPLAESSLENFAMGLGVAPPSTSGVLQVGPWTDKRQERILLQLKAPGGKKRWMLFHKCVNKGTTKSRAGKSGKTIYPLEMKAYLDSAKGAAGLFDLKDV